MNPFDFEMDLRKQDLNDITEMQEGNQKTAIPFKPVCAACNQAVTGILQKRKAFFQPD